MESNLSGTTLLVPDPPGKPHARTARDSAQRPGPEGLPLEGPRCSEGYYRHVG
jgi:hypothetical protein